MIAHPKRNNFVDANAIVEQVASTIALALADEHRTPRSSAPSATLEKEQIGRVILTVEVRGA